ncbi:MAG: hypothetical protein SFZ24_09990 [Planctomycetota bacterium]|nr:hypothetical protein [Planctomycetota bacterium]
MTPAQSSAVQQLLPLVERSGSFGRAELRGGYVHALAKTNPAAAFRAGFDEKGAFVAWVCGERYVSQSIEADLMWTGDDLSELIAEAAVDHGYSGPAFAQVEHYRDPDKLFTFLSRIPAASPDAPTLLAAMLGYSAAFGELGDMKPEEND